MSFSGEREESDISYKMSLSGESEENDHSVGHSIHLSQQPSDSESFKMERAPSPTLTCVSKKSDESEKRDIYFPSESQPSAKLFKMERAPSPTLTCVSKKSDKSEKRDISFTSESQPNAKLKGQAPVDMTGDPGQRLCQQHHSVLEVFCKTDHIYICKGCAAEEHKSHNKVYRNMSSIPDTPSLIMAILTNMKEKDFRVFKAELDEYYPGCIGSQPEDLDASGVVSKMLESFGTEGALGITLNFLHFTDPLKKVTEANKKNLGKRVQNISEGIAPHGKLTYLHEIYTDLYIIQGREGAFNSEHEVKQIEMISKRQTTQETPIKLSELFKPIPGQGKQIRSVLTKGIAGIGKTFSVQKFILDWAEGKTNQDIMVVVPLPFRDLNLKTDKYSLIQLLHHYAPELNQIKDVEDEGIKLLLIFDGLDECRFRLDFQNSEIVHDITKATSADVLLTNLIRGNLLPSALLWITSRPAAAQHIPLDYIHQITEIRGFSESQREIYIRKKISDQSLASKIINHIKSSRNLYIMCHIPVFCCLSATVLEETIKGASIGKKLVTLTEMYTHFLFIQISLKNKKFQGVTVENPTTLCESDKEMILKLGELAFQQLEKGNLIFYEQDLVECGIDVRKATDYSLVCKEVFREELALYSDKVFGFVHLSIQEHLAALYAHISCVNENINVFNKEDIRDGGQRFTLSDLHQCTVDKALHSKNGHLDLFLRFLLGLSQNSHHTLLQGLMKQRNSQMREYSASETIRYIKQRITNETSTERIINLFHCLNELNDNSVVEEIQSAFRSGMLTDKDMEPHQCSALAYMLLMSEEVLDTFDLNMYKTSVACRQRLLPVLRTCKSASVNHCNLSSGSCETVASALQSVNSPLTELDLSYNKLKDAGVNLLCAALMSPNCKLQKLWLRKCILTDGCCVNLATVLRSSHSKLLELELSYNDLQDSGVNLLSYGLEDSQCKLHKLGLAGCSLSNESCVTVASILKSASSKLQELDLSYNNLEDSGVKLICDEMMGPNCKLQKLRLNHCNLLPESCTIMASVLQKPNSTLKELDLSNNKLRDSGVKKLFSGLETPNCKSLQKLGLAGCYLSSESCGIIALSLQSENSTLTELDLSHNDLEDSGVRSLSSGLTSPNCKLKKLGLSMCSLTEGCCDTLASVLRSSHSSITDLELRDNDLKDSGVKLLSAGLANLCKLEKLSVAGCLITEEGCASLALALYSNPSHLRELDLSYNHPGDSGVRLFSRLLEDRHHTLKKLEVHHGGEHRMKTGPRKYACQLTLDRNTAHRLLILSEDNRKIQGTSKEQLYPDHPERFKIYTQVLCKEALAERCYWEAEWIGERIFIGAAYRSTSKEEASLGMSKTSFAMLCLKNGFSFYHNHEKHDVRNPPHPSNRVGVYLDWPAGTLSFYSIIDDSLTLLYTCHSKFTEPLYAAFMLYREYTISLCQLE